MASNTSAKSPPSPSIELDDNETMTTTKSLEAGDSTGQNVQLSNYLSGWRLNTLAAGIYLGVFLVNLEISIVSTSLVSITDDLKHFSQSSWIVTAYLLTYTSFIIIIAKLSDLFGRKTVILTCMLVFTAFSGGCAASQTMTQLIVCRAIQGIGGCGVYSLVMVIIFEMVPPAKYSFYLVILTLLFALSMTLGPILGGVINDHGSWIWVFLLNVPAGALCMLLLGIAIPKNFPNHGRPYKRNYSINRIDFIGAILLLAAMTLHITGLEEAANLHGWKSRVVLLPLILSAILWICFIVSQYFITKSSRPWEPVFPWRFFQNRVAMGLILNAFLSGAISTTSMIQIPIRSQAADGMTALKAGVNLIPFSLSMQFGAMLVAALTKKQRLAPVYMAFVAAIMQLAGVIGLSVGNPDNPGYKAMYGIEVVLGLGVGLAIGVTTLMMPYATEKRDLSVGTASIIQFRFLGGATALAICTAVANTWLRDVMLEVLPPVKVLQVFHRAEVINSLPDGLRDTVRGMFVKAFNLQMRILIGFAVAQFPVTFLTWKKKQIMMD